MSHACVKQPQVVVDFSRRSYRRPGISRRILLPDRNGRRDSDDFIHVRLFDPLEKLARVGRKRLDVAPLALGIQRIECQAGLSRSGNACNHRDRVVRDREADIFQVVDARAPNLDRFFPVGGVARSFFNRFAP